MIDYCLASPGVTAGLLCRPDYVWSLRSQLIVAREVLTKRDTQELLTLPPPAFTQHGSSSAGDAQRLVQ
jgi:hypothetical protein